MKKLLVVMMALALVAGLSSISYAQTITGTVHDLTSAPVSASEICAACHTPHNSDTSVTNAPLWDHDVTVAAFQAYSSLTLDATDVGQPDGVSKLCLSCHDGTVALDSFGGATGTTFIGSGLVGTDLRNDHPISFTYDAALATLDGGLFNPTSATTDLGGTIDNDLLIAGEMECATCHNVHDNSISPFLKIDNAGSNLCLTCHNK